MTCTSIVQFNFPLKTDINKNTVNQETFNKKKILQNQLNNQLNDCKKSEQLKELILNECVNTNISTNNMNNGLSNGHDLNFDFDSGHLISSSSFNTNTELSSHPTTNCVLNPSSSSNSILSNINQTGEKMGILENEKSRSGKSFLVFKESKMENGQSLIVDPDSKWDIKTDLLNKVDSLPQIDSSTPLSINKTINYSENVAHTAALRDNLLNNSFLFQKNDEMENLNLVQNCDEKNDLKRFNNLNNNHYIKKESSEHNYQISVISDPVPIEEPSKEQLKNDQSSMLNCIDKLEHKIRKLQFHQTNKIINKQMKQFVIYQQRLNSVKCQRLELNVTSFLNNYSHIQNKTNLDVDVQNNLKFSSNFSNVSIQVLNESPSPNINFQNFILNQPDCIQKFDDETNKQEPQQNLSNHIQQRNRVSQENQQKIFTTIEALRFNLRHCESKYDSDATDSSSGGESCDELEENEMISSGSLTSISTSTKNTSNLQNKLSSKWCNERNAIASRWSWLQAHIVDLENKLRQQTDVFCNIRRSKGSVNFGENNIIQRQFPSNVNVNHLINQTQPKDVSFSIGNSSINNNNLMNCSNNIAENAEHDNLESEEKCMRLIPFISRKSRKLIWAKKNLSMPLKNDVKYSSINCSCNTFGVDIPPCTICNGRFNYNYSIDTEFMPIFEIKSLLNDYMHPIIYFKNDTPVEIYCNYFLMCENNNPIILRTKNKKKYITHLKAHQENKVKKSLQPGTPTLKSKKRPYLKLKKRRLSTDSLKKYHRDRLSSGCSSHGESPVPSPATSETSSTEVNAPTPNSGPVNRRRRSEQHAFDINNIVIPYSIASATRVERLQYKEIITPKWRLIEEYSIPPPENIKQELLNKNYSNVLEDMSDKAFEIRHAQCEANERKRIMSYYGNQNQKNQNIRKCARVRFESKSDSQDQTSQESYNNNNNNNHYNENNSKIKTKAQNEYERKRNSSISRTFSKEDNVYEEPKYVPPYELRQFPLTDCMYEKMVQESNHEQFSITPNLRPKTLDLDELNEKNSHSPLDNEINEDESMKVLSLEATENIDDPDWKPNR